MAIDSNIRDHKTWIGYLQPEGLVVSPAALVDAQVSLDLGGAAVRQRDLEQYVRPIPNPNKQRADVEPEVAAITDLARFLGEFLRWPTERLQGFNDNNPIPDELKIPLRDFGETLQPTYAFTSGVAPSEDDPDASPWLLLIEKLEPGTLLDVPIESKLSGWSASPSRRFERLLRESGVPIGLLSNGTHLHLFYAPRGENAGRLTFPVGPMGEIPGRPIVAALEMLLSRYRLLAAPTKDRLPGILKRSRDYQARVSNTLSGQVLDALYEMLRGFQAADTHASGELLKEVLNRDPDKVYQGLLAVLMRSVFLLYAEDQSLMPDSGLYNRNYSVHGLYQRLRTDHEQYPDTMENRYGAWAQLLVLFRLVYSGNQHILCKMPAREGHLFDPNRYPFLEGRRAADEFDPAKPLHLPLVPDGTVFRVLEKLLVLDGERLSYRTLDVEQIGSVYETMIGFGLETATEPTIALNPGKSNGAPVPVSLVKLLVTKPDKRAALIQEQTDYKLTATMSTAVKAADSIEDLLVCLENRIARRATPGPVPEGTMLLVPTDERRRSGSHYTPRSLTEPIVRTTLEPIFEQMGDNPLPAQILDLKICDPAMGSGAFLVEACRQLAEKLVASWAAHGIKPYIPPDEDQLLHARRLVAQRCLYGVDKNPMAVDLAKLSLWLTTLAKDHPFTFVDHSLRCGDSLVGLTRKQIASFHWDTSKKDTINRLGLQDLEGAIINARISRAASSRKAILEAGDAMLPGMKHHKLTEADTALNLIRMIGDACLSAHFSATKTNLRKQTLDKLFLSLSNWFASGMNPAVRSPIAEAQKQLLQTEGLGNTFHWEIEFPEVFDKSASGFDAVISNPPFVDSETMVRNTPKTRQYVADRYENASGNWDLYIPFVERFKSLTRQEGAFTAISPNKWLGAPYGKAIRNMGKPLLHTIFDYSTGRAFEGVGVAVICSFFQKASLESARVRVFREHEGKIKNKGSEVSKGLLDAAQSWGIVLSEHCSLLVNIAKQGHRLGKYITAHDPFTVSEAYELKDMIVEVDETDVAYFKFINTGTVDPFVSLWGENDVTYLKSKFRRPVVPQASFLRKFPRRFSEASQAKIILSGMRKFEAFLDEDGSFIAGKSSIVARSTENIVSLRSIVGLLNSKLIRFYLQECYGVLGIDGGISFSGTMVQQIPLPKGFVGSDETLELLVATVLRAKANGRSSLLEQENLDNYIYSLYGIASEDVAVFEDYQFKC